LVGGGGGARDRGTEEGGGRSIPQPPPPLSPLLFIFTLLSRLSTPHGPAGTDGHTHTHTHTHTYTHTHTHTYATLANPKGDARRAGVLGAGPRLVHMRPGGRRGVGFGRVGGRPHHSYFIILVCRPPARARPARQHSVPRHSPPAPPLAPPRSPYMTFHIACPLTGFVFFFFGQEPFGQGIGGSLKKNTRPSPTTAGRRAYARANHPPGHAHHLPDRWACADPWALCRAKKRSTCARPRRPFSNLFIPSPPPPSSTQPRPLHLHRGRPARGLNARL